MTPIDAAQQPADHPRTTAHSSTDASVVWHATGTADTSIDVSTSDCDRPEQEYAGRGYVRFVLPWGEEAVEHRLLALATSVGLNEPFVPPVYSRATKDLYSDSGLNVISTSLKKVLATTHLEFASQSELALHTDGTLQDIGRVSTMLLFCVTPASDGGDTILFDGVAAFHDITGDRPDLAAALLSTNALVRHAFVDGVPVSCTGPVFARRGDIIVSRYSVTPRDEWRIGDVPGLEEAREALAALATPASPYYRTLRLDAGHGIFVANDRMSHGRTAFADRADAPRRLIRGLYRRHPFARILP